MEQKKNNNHTTGNPKLLAKDALIYIEQLTNEFDENAQPQRERKMHDKFITSEEDDSLDENMAEDQEEQNQIHNNFFDNQPQEKKKDVSPPRA